MFYQQELIAKEGVVSYSTDFNEVGRTSNRDYPPLTSATSSTYSRPISQKCQTSARTAAAVRSPVGSNAVSSARWQRRASKLRERRERVSREALLKCRSGCGGRPADS
jgi:hypothetical protein